MCRGRGLARSTIAAALRTSKPFHGHGRGQGTRTHCAVRVPRRVSAIRSQWGQPMASLRQFKFSYLSGVISDVKIWSSTSVSGYSSGGGGYVSRYGGHISAPNVTVSSVASHHQRFFLEDKKVGVRNTYEIHPTLFPVADGDQVIVIRAKKRRRATDFLFFNKNSGASYFNERAVTELIRGSAMISAVLLIIQGVVSYHLAVKVRHEHIEYIKGSPHSLDNILTVITFGIILVALMGATRLFKVMFFIWPDIRKFRKKGYALLKKIT